jgi:subtilase family serine protease
MMAFAGSVFALPDYYPTLSVYSSFHINGTNMTNYTLRVITTNAINTTNATNTSYTYLGVYARNYWVPTLASGQSYTFYESLVCTIGQTVRVKEYVDVTMRIAESNEANNGQQLSWTCS